VDFIVMPLVRCFAMSYGAESDKTASRQDLPRVFSHSLESFRPAPGTHPWGDVIPVLSRTFSSIIPSLPRSGLPVNRQFGKKDGPARTTFGSGASGRPGFVSLVVSAAEKRFAIANTPTERPGLALDDPCRSKETNGRGVPIDILSPFAPGPTECPHGAETGVGAKVNGSDAKQR